MAPAKEATEAPKTPEWKDKERPDTATKENGEETKEKQGKKEQPFGFKNTPLFKLLAGPLSVDTLAAVKDAVDKGADVHAVGSFKETYLHVLMAPRDNADIVVTDRPSEDRPETRNGERNKDDEVTREEKRSRIIASLVYQLAAAGIKMNRKDQEGNTALHIAAINDQPPVVVAALVQVGLDPCLLNASEEDATYVVDMSATKKALMFYDLGLWRAAGENNLKKTAVMLSAWCKIDVCEDDDEEETLMSMVTDKEQFDIVVALKSHLRTNKLIHAAFAGKHEEVKELVKDEGADVNVVNVGHFNLDGSLQGMPLLGELVLFGRYGSAKLLVKKGANVNVMVKAGSNNNEEPLFYYLLQRIDPVPVDVFKVILKKANMSLVKPKYVDILRNCWERKIDSELVGIMVSRGLTIGIRDDHGYNLRDIIVQETCNAENEERKQALYYVDEHILDMVMEGRIEELKFLAVNGYSYVLVTNRKGKPILKFAQKDDQTGVLKSLQAYPEYKKRGYKVYNAILKGNLAEVRDLMNETLADSCDCLGRSPLQLAVLYERRFIFKWLLKKFSGSVNSVDEYGRSALHYAYMIPSGGGDDFTEQLMVAKADEILKDRMGMMPSDYKNQPNKRTLEAERLRPCGIDTVTLDRYLTLRDCIKAKNVTLATEVIDKIVEFHPRNFMDLPSQFPQLVYKDLLFLCIECKQQDIAIALIKARVPYNHTGQIAKENGTSEAMKVRGGAEYKDCDKLVEFLDEYKPEPAEYEERNGHMALAAAMALADSNSGYNSRGNGTPESDISLPGSPSRRPDTAGTTGATDTAEQQAEGGPPASDVKNSSSCVIL